MKGILESIILNVACFVMTYVILPHLNAAEFLLLTILVPLIYNVLLVMKSKAKRVKKRLTLILYVMITTFSYVILGLTSQRNGLISDFAMRNSYSDQNITISISDNMISCSNIVFINMIQICAMFMACHLKERKAGEVKE